MVMDSRIESLPRPCQRRVGPVLDMILHGIQRELCSHRVGPIFQKRGQLRRVALKHGQFLRVEFFRLDQLPARPRKDLWISLGIHVCNSTPDPAEQENHKERYSNHGGDPVCLIILA